MQALNPLCPITDTVSPLCMIQRAQKATRPLSERYLRLPPPLEFLPLEYINAIPSLNLPSPLSHLHSSGYSGYTLESPVLYTLLRLETRIKAPRTKPSALTSLHALIPRITYSWYGSQASAKYMRPPPPLPLRAPNTSSKNFITAPLPSTIWNVSRRSRKDL